MAIDNFLACGAVGQLTYICRYYKGLKEKIRARKSMVRRSRIRAILLLPLGLLLFVVGWGFYNAGNKKAGHQQKMPAIVSKKAESPLDFAVLPPEMQEIPA